MNMILERIKKIEHDLADTKIKEYFEVAQRA